MVPARNLLRRHYDSYGGWFGETQSDSRQEKPSLRPDPMAEEHSRTGDEAEDQEEGEVGTSSKDADDWLRLGIGGGGSRPPSDPTHPTSSSSARVGRLMELDLFSDKPTPSLSSLPLPRPLPPLPSAATFGAPLLPPQGLSYRPWGSWNANPMMATAPAPPPLQYSFRRFVCPPGVGGAALGEMRVASPPRRPQAGVWFLLRAAQNQLREPFLPQIPKSYLRIKDGRMTVRLLMKYLVSKLGLDDESEVEITCRGQPLLPSFTLHQVRDHIWCPTAAVDLFPDSTAAAAEHVMALQYGRRTRSS